MAYLQLFFYIVASLPFMFISLSHSSLDYDSVKTPPSPKYNNKVTLSLYYETLCPYSATFISEDLVRVFQNDLDTIVDLRLVPWGNAFIDKNRTHCQHGEDECYLNTIHSCVIHFWPDVKKHFEFISCTELQFMKTGLVKTKEKLWEPCSARLKFNESIIKQCYKSGYGDKLELRYANETAHLRPRHDFVPWVVVNNQPIREDFVKFVKYVCQAYKGDRAPKACKEQSSNVSSTDKKANKLLPVCNVNNEFRNLESSTAAKTYPGM